MDSDAYLNQEYEKLNDAILKAILGSKEVQKILARFKIQGQMNDKSVLNLILSLDELYQMIDENTVTSDTYKLEPGTSTPATKSSIDEETIHANDNIIDGKLLTSNETLFEEYYQGNFNETNWLKKARIRF